jgi:integrase
VSGTVKHAKLETKTSRARLERKQEPHWRALIVGRAHLGWQRQIGGKSAGGETKNANKSIASGAKTAVRDPGRWILRRFIDSKYSVRTLGWADDLAEADGEQILSFEQAEAKAKAMLDTPAALLGRLTVKAAMTAYIEFQRDHGKPVDDLISRTNAHILPTLGDCVVVELTTERLRKWRTTLAAMPAMKRTAADAKQAYKAEPASEEEIRRRRSSTNRVLTMLKAGLNRAFKDGKVASDLAWRRVEPFRAVDSARVRYLSVTEAKRLINTSDREFRPLVRAALETGCRYGELIRLEVTDFNPDVGTVFIRQSKSGEPRHVVLTREGAEFFTQVCAGRVGGQLMFVHSDGKPWKSSQQARPIAEACARARIDPPITFHALRHTWASHAVMNGVPLMIVARNLGHVDTRMVEKHYGHLAPSYVADAIRANAPKFGPVRRKVVPLGLGKSNLPLD